MKTKPVIKPKRKTSEKTKAVEREKVYCKGCKYISGRGNYCDHPEFARDKTLDTAYSPVILRIYGWIDEVNKNNDCPNREDAHPREPAPPLTFWQRLKGMFR